MRKSRWLLPLAALAGAWLYREWRRGSLGPWPGERDRLAMPNPRLYSWASGLLLRGVYDLMARELAAACRIGSVLDVGAGPGWLDIRLAELAPGLSITGVDADAEMVAIGTENAARAGLGGRVLFRTGDAARLPFEDGQFDLVISSFSVHHWEDPVRGVSEIHRVLKADGQARIYDIPDWFRLRFHGSAGYPSLLQLAAGSPFGGGVVATLRWPFRLPSGMALWMRKASPGG